MHLNGQVGSVIPHVAEADAGDPDDKDQIEVVEGHPYSLACRSSTASTAKSSPLSSQGVLMIVWISQKHLERVVVEARMTDEHGIDLYPGVLSRGQPATCLRGWIAERIDEDPSSSRRRPLEGTESIVTRRHSVELHRHSRTYLFQEAY